MVLKKSAKNNLGLEVNLSSLMSDEEIQVERQSLRSKMESRAKDRSDTSLVQMKPTPNNGNDSFIWDREYTDDDWD